EHGRGRAEGQHKPADAAQDMLAVSSCFEALGFSDHCLLVFQRGRKRRAISTTLLTKPKAPPTTVNHGQVCHQRSSKYPMNPPMTIDPTIVNGSSIASADLIFMSRASLCSWVSLGSSSDSSGMFQKVCWTRYFSKRSSPARLVALTTALMS